MRAEQFSSVVAAFITALLLGVGSARGQHVIYVNQNVLSGSQQNGTSWANAYTDLQAAIAVAQPTSNNPVELWVATGTYKPGAAQSSSFVLKSYLRIVGGFKGTETNINQRYYFGYPTVLSGDIGVPEENEITQDNALASPLPLDLADPGLKDNCINVLYGSNVTDVVLDQLYITGGYANVATNVISDAEIFSMTAILPSTNNDPNMGGSILPLDHRIAGGGVCVINPPAESAPVYPTLILNNCVFENNAARGYGGAVAAQYAAVLVADTTFSENVAGSAGGAYWEMNSQSIVSGCNFVTNESLGDGGAIVHIANPTDDSVDPFHVNTGNTTKQFQTLIGFDISAAQFAKSALDLGGIGPALRAKLNSITSGAKDVYNFLFGSKPKVNPNVATDFEGKLVPAVDLPASTAASTTSAITADSVCDFIGGAYDFVSIGVTVGSIVVDILQAEGGGNQKAIQGWNTFANFFNTWFTPQGYLTMFLEAVGLIQNPSPQELANEVKQMDLGAYNQTTPYSEVAGCQFIGNFALNQGGAVLDIYANVQTESCFFQGNSSRDAAGMANQVWTTPIIISCVFVQNESFYGASAINNSFHCRAQIINCTFSDNLSVSNAGYAMQNELGSDVTIANSIFWGNSNMLSSNYNAGADIFTIVHTNLSPVQLTNYDDGLTNGTYVEWVTLCDISWSDVQSLNQLPLGSDQFQITFPPGTSYPEPNQIQQYLMTWNTQLETNDLAGLLDTYNYINVGEGFRANILDPRKHNISQDPLLINGYIPYHMSPVINAGNSNRFDNPTGGINTDTGEDALLHSRVAGANIDMGAIEYQGGADPQEIAGLPQPASLPALNVIYVTPSGTGDQSGSSWLNATSNLRQAMTNSGYQVWAAAGTYYPTSGTDRTAAFSLAENVQVYGGFTGSETSLSERNWARYRTILSGDIGVRGVNSDNSFNVVSNANIEALSVLDGFTITLGRGAYGGGVFNYNASPVFTNCAFVNNQATQQGGAIYSTGFEGSPVNQCTFSNNSAGQAGGAIYFNSSAFIENCAFADNSSSVGGAICFDDSEYEYVFNCLFVGNTVSGPKASGGAIEAQQTGITVYSSTFTENYVNLSGSSTFAGAGGLDFRCTDTNLYLSVVGSIFWRNSVTNAQGPVGSDEQQEISTNSNNPYFVQYNILQGLDQFAKALYSSNLDVDPLFTDTGLGDYSLLPYSAAIQPGPPYGIAPLVGPIDLAGNARVVNGYLDLGAYEFQGTPQPVSFLVEVTRSCGAQGASYTLDLESQATAVTIEQYQWEVNKNDGAGFNPISDGPVYSGTLTGILSISDPPPSMNGYRYVVVVSALVPSGQEITFTSESGTIFVSPTQFFVNAAATGSNNGLSWTNAFTNLQSALAAAGPCSQVWVAAGTYYPSASGDATAVFRMASDVGIYGGFAGNETSLSQRNWVAHPTILSGNLTRSPQTNGHSISLIVNYGGNGGAACDASAMLDGFTLRDALGSAMQNFIASPTVRNCIFTNNTSEFGGAIYNSENSAPLCANCVFEGNSSLAGGGAMYCGENCGPKFVNCLFANNSTAGSGGALNVESSKAQVINCTMANNFALINGGGIYSQSATNLLFNSILWGNADEEQIPVPAGPQLYADVGALNDVSNSCVEGETNLGASNIDFDPLFAAPATGNFQLSAFSPCINAGNNSFISGYATDLNGNNRIVDSVVDMGAYEYQSGPQGPVDILLAPVALTACSVAGQAVFSVTGTAGSASNFTWRVNQNNGQGFIPVQTNASVVVVPSNNVSFLILSNLSLSMNGYAYEAVILSNAFATPPVTLTVASPQIIYVNSTVQGGAGDGASWANAFPNLQNAINSAPSCSEIWVAKGTYMPIIDAQNRQSFRLISGVAVYGGFNGTETSLGQRNWTNNPTIITGGINGRSLFENDSFGTPIDASAVLDGFIFKNATVTAIDNFEASPTIQNCAFTGISQIVIGNRLGAPTISSCVFSNNNDDCIFNQQTAAVISHCIFIANQNPSAPGAIYNWESSPVVTDSLFQSNSFASGGAIFNDSQTFGLVDRCRFLNNAAGDGGAIYTAGGAAPTIKNCLFDQNSCTDGHGGAIADYGSGSVLDFCTLTRNSGAYSGAGIYFQGTAGTVDSCILWDNTAVLNPQNNSVALIQVDNSAGRLTISNSTIQGWPLAAGANNVPFDPLFANLAGGNFELTPFSPALDSGNLAAAAAEPEDVIGQPRVFAGTVDRGAFELQASPSGEISILQVPQSLTNCAQTSAQFEIVTQPGDTTIYQWQLLSGGSFVPVQNAPPYSLVISSNTNSLIIPSLSLPMNGTVFRLATGTGYTSAPFTLGVTPPAIIYVNANAATPGNGSSWAAALTNLQTAFLAGDPCTEIWVARGTYYVTDAPDNNPSLVMKQGMRAYGGFAGFETNLSQRNWTTNIVVLRGQTHQPAIFNDGSETTIDQTALLDGFTLDGTNNGGVNVVLNVNASPTFQNCAFINGSPGIWNSLAGNPVILNCVFSNNVQQAMVNENCSPVVSNCVFVNNSGASLVGGAVYNYGASPRFLACQFLSNSAGAGAALGLDGGSSVTVARSLFEGNNAGDGGAIYAIGASAALFSDDIFTGNFANQAGALLLANGSIITVNNCTMAGNSASAFGAGVVNQSGTLAATNSIFWNNVDFTGATESAQINNQGGAVAVAYSIVTRLSKYAGNQNLPYDPLFQSAVGNNFTPLANYSPALNAGLNSAVAPGDTDFFGNPRIVASVVDIGAVENQNPGAPTPVDLVSQPQALTSCAGGTAVFTVVGATNSGSQFTWVVDAGGGLTPIPADGFQFVWSNNNSATLSIINIPTNYDFDYHFIINSIGYVSPAYHLTIHPRRIVYVNAAATGRGTGENWADAFTNFANGLASGDSCSQVWVAAGTYFPVAGRPARLSESLQVFGGFVGTENALNQRNFAVNPTVLRAIPGTSAIDNEGNAGLIDRTTILDGFVLTGGSSQFPIINNQASPTIRNCLFVSNAVSAAENVDCGALLDACVFSNNSGGALDIRGSAGLTVSNCVFASNQSAPGGAAISVFGGAQTTVFGCLFTNNQSTGIGGAIQNSDNAALAVVNSIFANNSATADGGAIANLQSSFCALTNCLFYGGSSFIAGGVFNDASSLTLVNCTLANNTSQSAVGSLTAFGGNVTMLNTILFQNSAAAGPFTPTAEGQQIYNSDASITATNCLIQGLTVYRGNNNISSDPDFLNSSAGNYQLSPVSPAINAGSNAYNLVATDAAGEPRVQLGIIDLGAFESPSEQAPLKLVLTPSSQSVCANDIAVFSVQSQSFQNFAWQYFDGTNWDDFNFNTHSGVYSGPALGTYQIDSTTNSSALTVSGLSPGMSGYEYRFTIPGTYNGAPLVLTVSPSGVIYVNASRPIGGNGQSWSTAFSDLPSALGAIQGCRNQVWIAAGTYRPTSGSDTTAFFAIPPGAGIHGGFNGSETLLGQRNAQSNQTILTGSIGTAAQPAQSAQVVGFDGTYVPLGADTVLDGVTISGGQWGVECSTASPTIANCVVQSNSGAGFFLIDSSPLIAKCSILDNTSLTGGGGVFTYIELTTNTGPVLENCVLSGNSAPTGGALFSQGSSPVIIGCLLYGNSATGSGGAVAAAQGNFTIVNSTITSNSSRFDGGGGIGVGPSLAVVENSIIWNNSTSAGSTSEQAQIDLRFGATAIVSNTCVEGLATFTNGLNLANDPAFVNAAAANYRLQNCSPLINAGNNVFIAGLAADLDGNPRIVNGVVDLGAYENQDAAGTPILITAEPASFIYCPLSSNAFTVGANGTGLGYQWEVNRNNGAGFVVLTNDAVHSGVTNASLAITDPTLAMNQWQYLCQISSGAGCDVDSSIATLTVDPAQIYVRASAASGGNGLSWAGAFQNIQQALASSLIHSCQPQIWVAAGAYGPGFVLQSEVQIYGGFAGTETNFSQRNPAANPTLLRSSFSASVVTANGSQTPCDYTAVLDGFVISSQGNSPGILLQNAAPTIRNCNFLTNNGNAILIDIGSSPIIQNCVFANGATTPVMVQNSSVASLYSCTFASNNTDNASILNNSDATVMLEGCVFTGNRAIGEGIENENGGTAVVLDSIFTGNSGGGGGAMLNSPTATMAVTNCLFVGNTAYVGGAVVNEGTLSVVNSTFYQNSAPNGGSGVDAEEGSSSFYNSIFWQNVQTTFGTIETSQIHVYPGVTNNIEYCLIQGLNQYAGPGNVDVDPLFAGPAQGNFQLTSFSPAVNAGSNMFIGNVAQDLAGQIRVVDGTVDLGPYELQVVPSVTAV